MSTEIRTYPGRPNWCPGALIGDRRVRHDAPVPTADLVREELRDGIPVRVVLRGATGLCSSCAALEWQERETRRGSREDAPRTRGRGRAA